MGFRLQDNKFIFDNDPSQEMWNTLGGNTGSANDNFFAKKASSIGNAIGTTLSAPISDIRSGGVLFKGTENIATDNLRTERRNNMNDIAKKYGYDSWDAWQDAYANVKNSGDENRIAEMDNQLKEFQSQANTNANKTKEKADAYKDYRENNLISKNINQDAGKFLGSAMNTLSTAADVGLMVAGIPSGSLFNAGQGAFEGVADELEQNGLENFDWGRAGQNAAIGAASGAVTGALNNTGVMRNLGQGKISQAVLGSKVGQKVLNNSIGRAAQAVGTGAVKGAISGAVGGATGAGLSAAMNNQDVLGSAVQGAMKGAQGGAMTGGIMAGANLATNAALNKITPNTMEKVRANQARNAELGDNMIEQWKNARTEDTWGNRAIDSAKSSLKNVGMSIKDVSGEAPEDLATANQNKIVNEPQPTSLEKPTMIENNAWDDVAKEYGYNNYDEAARRYMQANPNKNPDATDILDWLDKSTAPTNKDAARQRLRDIKADALRTRAAEDLLNQVGTAKAPAAKADNMVENVKQFMNEGLTKPEEWQLASDAITGANGVMSRLHRNLVSQAGDIDTYSGLGGKYGNTIDETIDYIIKAEGLVDSDAKGIKNEIMAVINSLPSRTDGSINMSDSADSVMSGIRELEAHRRNYLGEDSRNRSTTTPYKDQKARVIKKVTSMLEDRIYDNIPDAKTIVTQDAINELKSYFPGNSKWEASVDEKFNNIKTGKDLRAVQKRYVQASDYLRNIKENYGTYGQRVGDAYGNALSQGLKKVPVVGGLLAQATNTPFMNRRYADINSARANRLEGNSFADSVSNIPSRKSTPTSAPTGDTTTGNNPSTAVYDTMAQPISSTGGNGAQTPSATGDIAYNPSTQLYNAIGRIEGAINRDNERAAQYLTEVAQEAETVPNTLEGLVSPSATNTSNGTNSGATSVYNSVYGNTTNNNDNKYFPATGDYWTDLIGKAMSLAIDADDATAFGTLYGMYQEALSKNSKSSGKDYSDITNWNSGDRTKLLSAQNAMDQIDQLEKAYNDATGEQGSNAVQGWLRSRAADMFGGNLDPTAANYNNMAQSVGMGIVKNLINLGVTEADAQRYLQYLPALTDTKDQAKQKLDTLRSIYQSQINNLYSAYMS